MRSPISLTTLRRLTTTTTPPRDSLTLSLPDGRVLGYAEYGCPTGFPLLYFHGFPSSRLEAVAADALARRHGLRFIGIDRPGFGLSTFQPNRRIIDWPADVLAFADRARLPRFSVIGGSGGGPYALACAHALPPERLVAAGVMAGAPPWEAGEQYMSLPRRLFRSATRFSPAGMRALTSVLVGLLRWVVTTGPATRRIDKFLEDAKRQRDEAQKPPLLNDAREDEEVRTTADRRKELLRGLLFEPFAQGTAGLVQETSLLTEDWGLRFEDITFKVTLWHGTQDTFAPIQMIRYMAERLPNCVLREYKDKGHTDMANVLEEILLEFVPKEMKRGQEV